MAPGPARAPLVEPAPAKVNLTLEVRGRRGDGYHELESLIVFARVGDRLRFAPGSPLRVVVRGPFAAALDAPGDNLVLEAARELAARTNGLELGRFELWKRLPVASGIGGGSSDAAAALRLLARFNSIPADDPRLLDAACATGADVPVCVAPCPRLVRGIGERLSGPLPVPRLAAVLVNPGVALATKDVFGAFASRATATTRADLASRPSLDPAAISRDRAGFLSLLRARGNDLEAPAVALVPAIAEVLDGLRTIAGCELARMSGSGATCFGIFGTARAALAAARQLRASRPGWWVCATALG